MHNIRLLRNSNIFTKGVKRPNCPKKLSLYGQSGKANPCLGRLAVLESTLAHKSTDIFWSAVVTALLGHPRLETPCSKSPAGAPALPGLCWSDSVLPEIQVSWDQGWSLCSREGQAGCLQPWGHSGLEFIFLRVIQQAADRLSKNSSILYYRLHKNTCCAYFCASLLTMHFVSPGTPLFSFALFLFCKPDFLATIAKLLLLTLISLSQRAGEDVSYNFHFPRGESLKIPPQGAKAAAGTLQGIYHPSFGSSHFLADSNPMPCPEMCHKGSLWDHIHHVLAFSSQVTPWSSSPPGLLWDRDNI